MSAEGTPLEVEKAASPKEAAIFLSSFEAVSTIITTARRFPKPDRPTLGKILEERAIAFLLTLNNIVGASGVRHTERHRRLVMLEDLSRGLDEVRLLLRISRHSGALSAGAAEQITVKLADVGRQLGGLLRATKQRPDGGGA